MQELNDVYNIQDTYGTEGTFEVDLNNPNQKNIWKILSLISWLLLISSQLNSLEFYLPLSMVDKYITQYHSTKNYQHLIMASNFFPQRTFLTISLIGFLIYLIFTVYQKDENVHSGLFNNLAKFHFLPLFLVSSLFIIGEAFNTQNFTKELEGNYLITFIINCFFSLVGLVLLFIIYIKTKLNCQWYITFFIKKGVYSSLIMLLWGNLLFNIMLIYPKSDSYIGVLFPVLRGLFPLVFSFIFKDIMVLFISLLYSVKTIVNIYGYFYSQASSQKQDINWFKEELAYISFIIIGITLASMIAIIIIFKHEIYLS